MLKHIQEENNIVTTKDELCSVFYSGIKDCSLRNVGLEFEKLPVNKNTFKASSYSDVVKFLVDFKSEKWDGVYEATSLLGLKSSDGTVTLEPGSQTELSLTPCNSIHEVKKYVDSYNSVTSRLAQKYDIHWLGYGIQPVSTYRNINIIPKKRYEYMTKYLPTVAKRPLVMMRETAGIQASFDYSSEEDAIKKFSLALKLSPIISAVFANSPVRNGHLTRLKSNRCASWLDTDSTRCGLVSSKAFDSEIFSFSEYVEILLDVPMIFIERCNASNEKIAIKIENLTFREFMKQGYNGYFATNDDWLLHLSLYFPDVRFKNYIEIRNHDNQRKDLICAVPAFWKGLIYNNNAIDEVNSLLHNFTYFDYEYLRRVTPQKGLDISIKHKSLKSLAKEIVDISFESLKSYGDGEEKYLEPMLDLLAKGLTPADIIISKWENEWRGDISKLVDYCRLS